MLHTERSGLGQGDLFVSEGCRLGGGLGQAPGLEASAPHSLHCLCPPSQCPLPILPSHDPAWLPGLQTEHPLFLGLHRFPPAWLLSPSACSGLRHPPNSSLRPQHPLPTTIWPLPFSNVGSLFYCCHFTLPNILKYTEI